MAPCVTVMVKQGLHHCSIPTNSTLFVALQNRQVRHSHMVRIKIRIKLIQIVKFLIESNTNIFDKNYL